jgi:hypothetical protein
MAFEGRLTNETQLTDISHPKIIPFERKVLAGKIIHLLHENGISDLQNFKRFFTLLRTMQK